MYKEKQDPKRGNGLLSPLTFTEFSILTGSIKKDY